MHISLQHVCKSTQADVVAVTLRVGREPLQYSVCITYAEGIEAARFDTALVDLVRRYPAILRALAHAIFTVHRGRRVQLPVLLYVSTP